MAYELKGIENQNGTDFYVLYMKNGDKEQFDYFNTKTFLKAKSVVISKDGEQSISFSDFKDAGGLLFPHAMNLMMGEMGLTGTVTKMEINAKIDPKVFTGS
jgi:hypothetical protein